MKLHIILTNGLYHQARAAGCIICCLIQSYCRDHYHLALNSYLTVAAISLLYKCVMLPYNRPKTQGSPDKHNKIPGTFFLCPPSQYTMGTAWDCQLSNVGQWPILSSTKSICYFLWSDICVFFYICHFHRFSFGQHKLFEISFSVTFCGCFHC